MKRKIFYSTLTSLLLAALVLGTSLATDGTLPGGTSISVKITGPSNDALISSTPGSLTLQGEASVGKGLPQPNTLIVYVIDVSFSTTSGTGCGGDQNGDGLANTVLDCEVAAAKALNTQAASLGTVGEAGFAVLGGHNNSPSDPGGAAADVGPAAGVQLLTGPATDAGGAAGPDIEEALSSVFSKGDGTGGVQKFTLDETGSAGTNFAGGLQAAVNIVQASTKPVRAS